MRIVIGMQIAERKFRLFGLKNLFGCGLKVFKVLPAVISLVNMLEVDVVLE